MEELNIPPPEPHSGSVWAAAINLMYCSISLSELTPEGMRAYGPLSPEAADRLDAIRAELDGLVAKLRTYLGKGAGGDLQQRLQQLGKTGDEIRLLSELKGSLPRAVSSNFAAHSACCWIEWKVRHSRSAFSVESVPASRLCLIIF